MANLNHSTATGIPTNIGFDHVGLVVPNASQAAEFLMEVFDAKFDWEVKRGAKPSAKERGWVDLFAVHPDAYLSHVIMLHCGDQLLTQYIELFEWHSPDHAPQKSSWHRFSDIGNSYISFTVKDLNAVLKHIKEKVIPKWTGVRLIQDPPMQFPLRGEVCTSTFLVSPWGMWIELTSWNLSQKKVAVMKVQQNTGSHPLLGKPISMIKTPAFLIDLDVVDHNAALMCHRFAAAGVKWRLTAKAHRCPGLTNYLLKKGAQGIVVLTLAEAVGFAKAGINDIYLANQFAEAEDWSQVSVLAKQVKRLRIALDNISAIEQLTQAVLQWEMITPVEILLELNVNHDRFGVTLEHILALAKTVKQIEATTGALKLIGITGYEGHTPLLPLPAKQQATEQSHAILKQAKQLLTRNNIVIQEVSGGGSCNYMQCLTTGVLTEVQAGGGAWGDVLYVDKAGLKNFGHKIASLVLTQIVALHPDRVICDAGFKTLGWHPMGGMPEARDQELTPLGVSAEHTRFKKSKHVHVELGEKILLEPGYTDAMGFLHNTIYAVRDHHIVAVWPTLQ